MSLLLDRLRRALAPQFTVEREIAGGGMGIVFRGHDVTLDRAVAIKVLRPEQATAIGVERFLREARLLARLRHPNIVPVHQGGEADGLLYHVLELQSGGTLADRLARGALDAGELSRLADGLLAALAAAHAAGVVHRDIKPANIFFDAERVVVADFGIAHSESAEESLTEPGRLVGTRRYMAPEQLRGRPATPACDVYAAGMVLLEAARGALPASGRDGFEGVPRAWVAPLRRALDDDPGARWPNAAAFRVALLGPRRRHLGVVAAAGLALAALAWGLRPATPPAIFTIAVEALEAGTDATPEAVESVRAGLVRGLTGLPDIRARAGADRRAQLQVTGTVRGRGSALEVALELRRSARDLTPVVRRVERAGLTDGLDSLVHDILELAWRDADHSEVLPVAALPRSTRGMAAFLAADRLYAAGSWAQALEAYEDLDRQDPTCALCGYRIRDLHRWLNRERDTLRLHRLAQVTDRFPEPYRELIEASILPPPERLARLTTLLGRRQRFFDFQYVYGDELMHRGPLLGRPRRDAIDHLEEARRLRPDFAGVIEHLLWVRIAEGDSAQAAALLAELNQRHEPRDDQTFGLRLVHQLGFLWRFHPPEAARATTQAALGDPALQAEENLPAGPRMLPAFGAPAGAVGFGALLEGTTEQPRLVRAGLVAQAFGWVALGRPDSAFRAAGDLARSDASASWRLVAPALRAWLVLLGEVPHDPALEAQLAAIAGSRQAPEEAMRARWWLAMLNPGARANSDLPAPLAALVRAEALARAGQVAQAITMTDGTDEADLRAADPFAAALWRLRRAEWLEHSGRHGDALVELLWHEHTDVPEIPRDEVQAAEVDWAAATVATWRRARILAAASPGTAEPCRHWAEVARRWTGGAPMFAARADSARQALAAHPRCRGGT